MAAACVETDDGFLFPFQPYDVQHDFMKNLFEVLESKQHGIFESPTGTGKSLSIICGSLRWLKNEQAKVKQELQKRLNVDGSKSEDDDEDWISSYSEIKKKLEDRKSAKEELDIIEAFEKKINDIRKSRHEGFENKKKYFDFSQLSSKRQKLNMQQLEVSSNSDEDEEDNVKSKETKKNNLKIFYASRTHSQLFQFMNELKKTSYSNDVTVSILGSRSNFCINESVKNLKKHSLINEKCAQLLEKNENSQTSPLKHKLDSCPFFKRKSMKHLQNSMLGQVLDIEDLAKFGKELKACPYYSARNIIPDAELIILPYNILLHKPTRESYGISLKNNVVIIDEAHNLLDAINNMYSAEVSLECLQETLMQLKSYMSRYMTRFSPKTLLYIKQLIILIQMLINYFSKMPKKHVQDIDSPETDTVEIMSYNEFISTTGICKINFFDLIQFCDENYIGNKLMAFVTKLDKVADHSLHCEEKHKSCESLAKANIASYLDQIKGKNLSKTNTVQQSVEVIKKNSTASFFLFFLEFLKTLILPTQSGRYMFKKSTEDSILKFLHLSPSLHFKEIINDARSVILAGGTMQPVDDFVDQLFIPIGVSKANICFHSYGHVVPAENVLVLPVSSGFKNTVLDFTYNSRSNVTVLEELSNILINLVTEVPGGLVCFFPSYSYEQYVYSYMHNNGILTSLSQKKKVFREPKEANAVETILNNYADAIMSKNSGGLLFCVVNGKMSEGINFSDDLCRCVIMVGMPYPNKYSPELKEKLKQLKQASNPKKEADYCSNLCMKAVNQSIGRAIRHKNDYAAIVLLDYRYCEQNVQSKLPSWLKRKFSSNSCISSALSDIKKFFSTIKIRSAV